MSGVMLITGGGRGIGAATARLAVEAGYAVAINYVSDRVAAEALAEELRGDGGRVMAVQGNVAELADVERMFAETVINFGPVTAVINNAGITGTSSRLDHAATETIVETIGINVTGAIFVAREAVKRMSNLHGGKGGVIVNLSSAAATLGSPREYVWYAASKGAIDSLTIGLGQEVAMEGIRVVGVAPGLTATDIHEKSTGDAARVARISPNIPLKRPGEADEIARAIMFAVSDAASYITATTIRVSGGR